MANNKEFAEVMCEIQDAYNKKFFIDDGVLQTWFKFFSDYEDDVISVCADKWIRSEKAPPTIHDLLEKCESEKTRRINIAKREAAERKEIERRRQEEEDRIIERSTVKFDPDNLEQKAKYSFYDGWRIDDDGYYIRLRI